MKNCDLAGGYRIMFQSLLLTFEMSSEHKKPILPWLETLCDLFFIHTNLIQNQKNEEATKEIIQIIEILQMKL